LLLAVFHCVGTVPHEQPVARSASQVGSPHCSDVTVKGEAAPVLIRHHAMKVYGGVKVFLHALTSALDGGEW
jgi:hypothetical protein